MTLAGGAGIIDREQVERAVHALNQYVVEQKKTNLVSAMDGVEPIQLQFGFKKIHPEEQKVKITLPHTLSNSSSEVCLFVKDLNKTDRDYQPTIKHYKKQLAKEGITCVSQIIPLKQIKLEYSSFEAKRNLSNMFDTFLADSSVVRLLPSLLGKAFYGRKKFPFQVNLNGVSLKREFNKALNLTYCVVTGRGPSGLVQVAHSGLSDQDSVENIMTVVEALCKSLHGGANNMKNMHIKTTDSPALLIYMSEEGAENVILPSKRKRKVEEGEFEDVTTVMGAKVKVTSDGFVRIKSDETLEAGVEGEPKKKNRPRSQRTAAKAKTAKIKIEKEKLTRKKLKEKNAKKNQKKKEKEARENSDQVDVVEERGEGMSEEDRKILEERRSRELDADLFSDTTADSELSDVEETTPKVTSVKNNPKSGKSAKSGNKGQISAKKGKAAVKAHTNTGKAKAAKKARYF